MLGFVHMDVVEEDGIRVKTLLENVSVWDKFQFLDALINTLNVTEDEWKLFVVARHEGIINDLFDRVEADKQ